MNLRLADTGVEKNGEPVNQVLAPENPQQPGVLGFYILFSLLMAYRREARLFPFLFLSFLILLITNFSHSFFP